MTRQPLSRFTRLIALPALALASALTLGLGPAQAAPTTPSEATAAFAPVPKTLGTVGITRMLATKDFEILSPVNRQPLRVTVNAARFANVENGLGDFYVDAWVTNLGTDVSHFYVNGGVALTDGANVYFMATQHQLDRARISWNNQNLTQYNPVAAPIEPGQRLRMVMVWKNVAVAAQNFGFLNF